MSESALTTLASGARKIRIEADEVVFRTRDEAYQFCLITSGRFCVELGTPVFAVLIQTLGPDDIFGWSALLNHHYSFFQVRALERSTAICLDTATLTEACLKDPKLAGDVYRRIADVAVKRLQAVELRLVEFCGTGGLREPREGDATASSSAA